MNPFEEDERKAAATARGVASKAGPGNPFAPDLSEDLRKLSVQDNVAKRKGPWMEPRATHSLTGAVGNPFAPDEEGSPAHQLSSAQSSSAQSNSRNPFASPDTLRSQDISFRSAPPSITPMVTQGNQTLKWTPFEHRETNLRQMCFGSNVALALTYNANAGESVISRRDLNALHKIDGSVAFRDTVDAVYMDPAGAHALVTITAGGASGRSLAASLSSRDAVFYLNPQDAVLKSRGPLPALAGLTCVGWFDDNRGYAALIGTAVGIVQLARFAHNGVSELVPFFKSPSKIPSKIVCVLPQQGDSAGSILVVEASGNVFCIGWDGQLQSQADVSGPKEPRIEVFAGLASPDGDFFLLSRKGLHRVILEHESMSIVLVLEIESSFALSQTELYVLVLSRTLNRQTNLVAVRLSCVSKITLTEEPAVSKAKVTIQGHVALSLSNDLHGLVYAVSESGMAAISILNEKQDAWIKYLRRARGTSSVYLAEQDFSRALKLCQRAQDKDIVNIQWGEFCFNQGRYVQAAKLFAETRNSAKPFEEVALLFSSSSTFTGTSDARHKKRALRTFMLGRLNRLGENKKTLKTMVCVWLCEVFLDEINLASPAQEGTSDKIEASEEEDVEGAFCSFLGEHAMTLEPAKEVVFQLILAHGRTDMMLVYAYLTRDFERVVSHHLQRNAPLEAIRAISDCAQQDPDAAIVLLYLFSEELFVACPGPLCELWTRMEDRLDITKLLSAISKFEQHSQLRGFAISFLEHCIYELGSREAAVHNALLSAYSEDPDDELFTKFIKQETSQPGGFCFDAQLALRLCDQRNPACKVPLLDCMGLPESAFSTALSLGLDDVAKSIAADQCDRGNYDFGKRLWLMCCKHAIDSSDVGSGARALDVMRASNGIINIEDILPLLPESVKLDDVRDEVCNALERYNANIDRLKVEMTEHLESDSAMQKDIREEKRRFDVVRAAKRCDLCRKQLLVTSSEGSANLASDVDELYVFPCTHSFHTRCICARLKEDVRTEVFRLLKSSNDADQAEAENTIGASCPLCGDAMIETINLPLIVEGHEEKARVWDIPQ